VAAWGIFADDPLGGEPVVVVATTPLAAGQAKADAGGDGRQHHRHEGTTEGAPSATAKINVEAPPPPGSKTVTIIDGSSGKSRNVVIPGDAKNGAPKAPVDRKLLEPTRHGATPKIGPDGARAFALYAEPREVPASKKDWPRIAVIVGGLGISASGTADALAQLPVTLALARLELAARERQRRRLGARLAGDIARIAKWAKTVEARGFVLMPITMVAVKAKSS
jgi:hypothetical protein